MPKEREFLQHPKALDVSGIDLNPDDGVIVIRWDGPNALTEQGLPVPIPAARKLLGYLQDALRDFDSPTGGASSRRYGARVH